MKPILFNDGDVRAILDGRKTQTRRVVTPKHGADVVVTDGQVWRPSRTDYDGYASCPYGQTGGRMWVREAWRIGAWQLWSEAVAIDYRADSFCRREWIRIGDDDGGEAFDKYLKQSIADAKAAGLSADEDGYYHWRAGESPCRWRPSIHMPRWASRITLEITDVRVQRLQEITEYDACAEGFEQGEHLDAPEGCYSFSEGFRRFWDSIAKPGAHWSDNPWVWAVSFKRVEA
ncbi:hypothetical protein DDE01_11630 [Desulfovibrio desulfuricans]|nr:hypothetical protein DDE01_11630 [Desulfovibrio desulfuricans]